MATSTANKRAIIGSPTREKTASQKESLGSTIFIREAKAIKNTGKRPVNTLIQNPGISSFFNISWAYNSLGGFGFIFFKVFEKIGPANIIAGMATITPYIKVSPKSAL